MPPPLDLYSRIWYNITGYGKTKNRRRSLEDIAVPENITRTLYLPLTISYIKRPRGRRPEGKNTPERR